MTHNRLVAGSNPAGATKFKLLNQRIRATFEVAFLLSDYGCGDKVAALFKLVSSKAPV